MKLRSHPIRPAATTMPAETRARHQARVPGLLVLAAGLAVAVTLAAGGAAIGVVARPPRPARSLAPAPRDGAARMRAACLPRGPRQARCYALYAPQASVDAAIAARAAGRPAAARAAAPEGWGATSIEHAYKLPVRRRTRATVAVVDAFSTPHLAADLAAYRARYHLPPCAAASKCLRIVNQHGQASPLPAADPQGWGVEETLDVSMVSAACPRCKIFVVEAKSPSFADLAAAEDTAARLGAGVISNSYGAQESGFTQAGAAAYRHPGHMIVASTGDGGFGPAQFPASLAAVTAVGGTQLSRASNARGWAEKAWNAGGGASGSGCSAYVTKPSWQHDPHCPGRTIADVAAVAWNVPMFDSSVPGGPWLMVGGTSVAAPLIAGVYALAGNASKIRPGYPYTHRRALFDITQGTSDLDEAGAACGHDYLCQARKGYDAPTGLGAPDGLGAF
jgi:Subtilase family